MAECNVVAYRLSVPGAIPGPVYWPLIDKEYILC